MKISRPMALLFCSLVLAAPFNAQTPAEWTVVDYSDLLDRRQVSHSGEPVSRLIEQLGGRSFPPAGQRASDRLLHTLLDPLTEPYGFVLSDALDALEPPHDLPLMEIAQLWQPGERQPAWVELLRSRRFVVESNGGGTLRVVLPWTPTGDPRNVKSSTAAQAAWDRAWPVLRHVFAAERRRLADSEAPPALHVRAYAYIHSPARSLFMLGRDPYNVEVDDTRSTGDRPPLDLVQLEAFLESGWTLEGGKLDPQGRLLPFGSRHKQPATLLGRKLAISDLAVAFRATTRGGLAEPYMSLDRGNSPWQSTVNYGGRLRNTSLGWVSLLCDIRFKTFSMGLGIEEGRDLRDAIRNEVPSFRTHMERFAADPLSAEVFAQQTRLWFYPDRVDLTVAPQSDVLAMRHVRMSAASERLAGETYGAAAGDDPPWTQATIAAVNADYDGLARAFPELADLDHVVRLLSFFTWLDQASRAGAATPDLDVLLAYDLPAAPTPSDFPQMLSFNALPTSESGGPVEAFDRVPVADGLEMMNPRRNGLLDPEVRLRRALAGLDRGVGEEAAFLDEVAGMNAPTRGSAELDLLTYRAQRLRMHRTVLGAFDPKLREAVDRRSTDGVPPRVLSVGVGGLDLGMEKVLARARSRSIGLLGAGGGLPRATVPATSTPREVSPETRARWREDPPGLPRTVMPRHGLGGDVPRREFDHGWIESSPGEQLIVYGAAGPEVVARRVVFGSDGRAQRFTRIEAGRYWQFTLERSADRVKAVRLEPAEGASVTEVPAKIDLPAGLALLRIDPNGGSDPASASVALRLQGSDGTVLDAATPRWVVQRLVMGREADLAHDPSLPGIAPLPQSLGKVETLMVLARPGINDRPWEAQAPQVPGEQDPLSVAAAIGAWWDAPDALPAPGGTVVGVDWAASPKRWSVAPRPGASALLVLPENGFPEPAQGLEQRLAENWMAGRVSAKADPSKTETLVLVVSAEAPGRFATRLASIARLPAMQGKLLAGWSLAGPVRDDLASWLLEQTQIAGVGIAEGSVVSRRTAPDRLRAIARELSARGKQDRVESIPGPFLWHF